MHFSVLVIGHDPEQQLEPYCEQLPVPAEHPAQDRHYLELVTRYGVDFTVEDAREIARSEGFEDATISDAREVTLLSDYNPDGRWDWWVPGGRWSRLLPTTEEAREKARDNELAGVNQADFGQVLWNADTLRLVHSVLIDGRWHDIGHGPEEGGPTPLEQFFALAEGVDGGTPVLVVDCHV